MIPRSIVSKVVAIGINDKILTLNSDLRVRSTTAKKIARWRYTFAKLVFPPVVFLFCPRLLLAAAAKLANAIKGSESVFSRRIIRIFVVVFNWSAWHRRFPRWPRGRARKGKGDRCLRADEKRIAVINLRGPLRHGRRWERNEIHRDVYPISGSRWARKRVPFRYLSLRGFWCKSRLTRLKRLR